MKQIVGIILIPRFYVLIYFFLIIISCSSIKLIKDDYKTMTAIKPLKDIERDKNEIDPSVYYTKIQFSGYYQESMSELAKEDWYRFYDNKSQISLLNNASILLRNYPDIIDSLSKIKDIILLNETHNLPYHRVLAKKILPILKKNGFNLLALETIDTMNQDIKNLGFPTQSSGYYSKELFYAEFVREAIRLGFEIIPYEPKNQNIENQRDKAMFDNIYKVIKNKRVKLFIYAGWSHISSYENMLGFYLKEAGFKTASFNTTSFNALMPNYLQDYIRKIVGKINAPHLLYNRNIPFQKNQYYDYEFIFPDNWNSKKSWIDFDGEYQSYVIKIPKNKLGGYYAIYKRQELFSKNEIPLDILHFCAKDAGKELFLFAPINYKKKELVIYEKLNY